MLEFIQKLFGTDFMPHVYCLRLPAVIWLEVISDSLIAASYFLIPAALLLVIQRRRDLKISWIAALFSFFILACGATHVLAVYTLWHPVYRLEGVVKAITAIASMATVVLCFRLLPQIIALPTPSALEKEVQERRNAERLNEALLVRSANQAVLDSAGRVAIISTDTQGLITSFNRGAEIMLQYHAEELVSKTSPAVIHLELEVEKRSKALTKEYGSPIHGFDVFAEPARRGVTEEQEWTYVRKDGTLLDVSLNVTAIRGSNGINGFLGIARDITAQKILERELRDQNLKLQEQTRRAESANLAKSEFLANMSHEIRTPMNGIIGLSALLLETELTAKQKKFVEVLRQSGDSLLNVINDILDFSKIEACKLELEITVFALSTVLEDAIRLLSFKAQEKGLALLCQIDPDVPSNVIGDAGRFRQVVLNLAGNALKFTERGGVSVRACLEQEDERSVIIRFVISDSGIGVPIDKQAAIFTPFAQVDGSISRRYGGTGLGLAICGKLVELLGGRIGVESEMGKGSTFWFTATFEKQPELSPKYASAEVACTEPNRVCVEDIGATMGTTEGEQAGSPLKCLDEQPRILLAEDNVVNQMVALGILERLGYRTDFVVNGKEALESLRRNPYDLVLMDCQMPEMNGYEATQHIRDPQSGTLNPAIPIIALTANAIQGDREKCLDAGMDDYISKPIRPAIMDTVIRKWLRR